ncbi:MAG: tetratricopeptide repeat protein [Verrucomicrobiota bacterium]
MIPRFSSFSSLLIICLFFTSSSGYSQNKPANEKSVKYLKALEKRPFSDLLFERFFDSWLEDHSIEDGFAYFDTQSKKSPACLILLARLYQRQGKLAQATSTFQSFTQNKSNSTRLRNLAWLELARISHLNRDYTAALKFIAQALESQNKSESKNNDPKTAIKLNKWHGRLLLKTGDTPAGLKVWQQLLTQYPEDELLREDVIALLLKEGVYDQAIKEQQSLIASADDNRDVHHSVLRKIELGKIYLKARRRKEALALWQNTLPLAGNDTWLERELIALIEQDFRRSNNLTGWQTALDDMIASEPKRLALHIARAKILTEQQQKDAALETWKHLLELTPGDLPTRLLYLQALITLDQLEPAISQLTSLTKQFPSNEELLFQLAGLQNQAGKSSAAGKSIGAYLKQSDGSEYAHLRAAKKLQRFKLTSDAQRLYEQTIARFPDSISAQDSFARFLYEHDQKQLAIKQWRAIAQSGDLNQLLSAIRQLIHRSETQAAFDLMQQRLDEFDHQSIFLETISQLALELDHHQQALSWSLLRLDLSSDSKDLQQAISLTLRTATQGKLLKPLAEKLQKEQAPSIPKTCLFAATRERLGDVESAIKILTDLSNSKEHNELILITLSQIYQREKNWSAAASTLESLISSPGGNKPSHISDLILLYQKNKDIEKALHWTREWKNLVNASPSPWLREADLLTQLGKNAESLKILQSAARRFEENDQIQLKLARAYTQAGYPNEAEHVLWKLYESTDDDWKRRNTIKNIVEIAQKNKHGEQVVARLQEQQRNNSQSVSPLLALAEVYRLLHQIPQQRDTLTAANRLDPNNIQLLHQIASAAQNDGRITAAIASLEKALKLDSQSRSSEKLAQLYMSIGRVQDALDLLDALPAGNKSSPERLIELAQVAMALGEWKIAARFLSSKINDHPDHTPLLYLRAVALLESEQIEAAQQALLKLLVREMPTNTNKPAATLQINAYQQRSRSITSSSPLFKPLENFKNLTNAYQRAVVYRNTFGEGRIFGLLLGNSPYQRQLPIPLPSDTTTLQGMTLRLLHRLQNNLQDPAQADLIDKKIASSEVAAFYNDFLKFSTPYLSQPHSLNTPAYLNQVRSFLIEHQNRPEAALIWVQLLSDKNLYDAKSASIFLSSIRQHYGAQAHALALLKLQNLGLSDDYSAELSEALAAVKEPDYYLFASASYQLIRLANLPTDKYPEDLSDNLLKLLKKTPATGPLNPQLLTLRAQAYAAAGDLDAWIKLLKTERGNSLAQKNAVPPTAQLNNIGRSTKRPIPFGSPPAEHLIRALNGFSPLLSHYLIDLTSRPNALTKNTSTWIREFSSDPILSALLTRASSSPELISSSLESLKEIQPQDKPNHLNASLLIALHQIESNQTTKAVSSLETIGEISNTPSLNKKIDLLLVQLANDGTNGSNDTTLRKSGIAAALRLRSSPLIDSRNEWPQIARILISWKIADKAQRPSSLIANHLPAYQRNTLRHATPPPALLSASPNFNSFTTQFNRIQKINPSPDALVRLAAHQLPIFASGLLNFQGENRKRQIQPIRQQLEQKKLISRVLDLARPEENAPLLQRARFAALSDALGESASAVQLYSQLLEELPAHQALRLRQFQLLAESEPDKARTQLRLLAQDKDILPHLGTALQALARLPYNNMEKRLDVAEWLLTTFDQLSKVDANTPIVIADPFAVPGEYRWSTQLVQSLTQAYRDGEINYPSLAGQGRDPFNYDPFSKEKKNLPKKPAHLLHYLSSNHKRIDLLQKLLIKQIETGIQTEQAFSSLVRLNAQTQNPDSELLPYCQKSLLHKSNIYRLLGNVKAPDKELKQGRLSWKNPNQPVPLYSAQTPLLWIIEYAFHHQQPELLEIPRLLAGSPQTEAKAQIEFVIKTLTPLYFCPDEQFNQLAEQLLAKKANTPKLRDPSVVQLNKNIINAVILRALALRPEVEKNFPWQDFIIARLGELENAYTYQKWAIQYCRALALSQDHDALAEFIEKISLRLVGAKNQQEKILSTYLQFHQQGRRSSDPSQQRLQYFVTLLASLTAFPETGFYALETAQHYGIHNNQHFIQSAQISRGMEVNDSTSLIALFNNSYLTRDLASYDTFPKSKFPKLFTAKSKSSSIISETLTRVKHHWHNKNSIRQSLLHQKNDLKTFGEKILAAMLADNPDLQCLSAFQEHLEPIKQLPIARQKEFASLAFDLIDLSKTSGETSRHLSQSVLWLQHISGKGPLAELDRIIAAQSISDLDIKGSSFLNKMSEIISQSIHFDWDKAYSAFENAALLGEKAVQEGEIRKSSTSFTDRLLKACTSKLSLVEDFRFVQQATQSKRLPSVFITADFRRTLSREMRSIQSIDKKIQFFAQAMKKLQSEVNTPSAQNHAFIALYDLFIQHPKDFKKKLQQWARDTPLQNELSEQIELALLIDHHSPVQETLNPQQFQLLLKHLEEKSSPTSIRLLVSAKLITALYKPTIPDKIIVIGAANLAASFAEDGPNISDKQFNPILDVFSKYVSMLPESEKPVELLKRLATAYSSTCLSNPPHASRISEPNYPSDYIAPLLTVLLQADKLNDAQSLLKKMTSDNFHPSQPFVILVREGAFDLAGDLLDQQWEKFLPYYPNEYFDKKLSKQFLPFLDSISSRPEWMKWIAKTTLLRLRSAFPNERDKFIPEAAITWAKQSERQAIIRDSLKAADFTNKKTLQQAYFAIKPFTPIIPDDIKKDLQEINRDQSPSSIAAIKDYKEKKHAERLFYELLAIDVADGKSEQWKSILLAEVKKDTEKKRITQTLQNLLSCLASASKLELAELEKTEKQIEETLRLWSALSKEIPAPRALESKNIALLIYPVLLVSKLENTQNRLEQYFSTLPETLLTTFSKDLETQSFKLRRNLNQLPLTRPITAQAKKGPPQNFRNLSYFTQFTNPALSRALIAGFTKISSYKEIAPKRKDFIEKIANKMNTASSTQMARIIFDHACKLIDEEVTAGNREWFDNDDNGWIYSSVFFHEHCKKASTHHPNNTIRLPSKSKSHYSGKGATNWLPIALLCDILWNDPPASFSFTWSNIYRLDEFFSHHWKLSNHGEFPDLPLNLIFSELRKSLPADQKNWGETSLFLPIFYETFRAIRDPEQVVIAIKVADQLADKEVLAREFSMAGRLWLASYLHLPEAAKDLAHPNAWIDRANEAFDSESLSPNLRASLARHFLYRAGDNCPEKLQRRLITEVTALIMNDAPLNGWELSLVSNTLLRMPRDNDWWQGATENFITAWNHKSRFDGLKKPEKIPFQPNLEPVLTMLALQLESGHTEEANKLIKHYEHTLQSSTPAIALLILHQQHKLALRWVNDQINQLNPLDIRPVGGAFSLYYTEKLDSELQRFLPLIKNPDQRILLGAMITAAPLDPFSINQVQYDLRSKRIVSLAKEFLALPASTSKHSQTIQQYLSRHHQAGKIMNAQLAKNFQSASIEKIPSLTSKTTVIYPVIQPLAAYVTTQALQGDSSPLRELMTRLSSASGQGSRWPYKVSVEQIAATLFRALRNDLRNMTPQQIKWAKEASQTFFETLEGDVAYNQLIYLSHSHIVLNALTTKKPLPLQWSAKLSNKRKQHFEKISRSKYVSPSYTILDQLLPASHPKFKLAKQALEYHVWLSPEE